MPHDENTSPTKQGYDGRHFLEQVYTPGLPKPGSRIRLRAIRDSTNTFSPRPSPLPTLQAFQDASYDEFGACARRLCLSGTDSPQVLSERSAMGDAAEKPCGRPSLQTNVNKRTRSSLGVKRSFMHLDSEPQRITVPPIAAEVHQRPGNPQQAAKRRAFSPARTSVSHARQPFSAVDAGNSAVKSGSSAVDAVNPGSSGAALVSPIQEPPRQPLRPLPHPVPASAPAAAAPPAEDPQPREPAISAGPAATELSLVPALPVDLSKVTMQRGGSRRTRPRQQALARRRTSTASALMTSQELSLSLLPPSMCGCHPWSTFIHTLSKPDH